MHGVHAQWRSVGDFWKMHGKRDGNGAIDEDRLPARWSFHSFSWFTTRHGIPEVGMSWKKPPAFITYVTRYKKGFPTRIYNFLKNPLVSY